MTNFELIKVYQGPIEMLLKANMRLKDARFVRLYEDYLAFIRQGQKVTYAVAVLTERYHVSERKVYQIISTFGKSCTMDAPGITPPT